MNRTIESLLKPETVRMIRDFAKVQDLKNALYESLFQHEPEIYYETFSNDKGSICIRVQVYLQSHDMRMAGWGSIVYSGVAACNPNDVFNVYIGIRLALRRALEPLPKRLRKHVWDYYLGLPPVKVSHQSGVNTSS